MKIKITENENGSISIKNDYQDEVWFENKGQLLTLVKKIMDFLKADVECL